MMKTIFYIAVFFILVLSTGCQKVSKAKTPTKKHTYSYNEAVKNTFYGELIKMPKNKTDFDDDISFTTYILYHRDNEVSNEELIKKISYKNPELFSQLQMRKSNYCLPKDSMIFLPPDLSKKALQSAKGDIHYFNTGVYENRDAKYMALEGNIFDQNKTIDLYKQRLIEYKPKMSVKSSGRKTRVRIHPKGNFVLQSVNKKKIYYKITFNHPTNIKVLYYEQPYIKVNGRPSEVEVRTYKICINGSCKNSFYGKDDNLNWQSNSYTRNVYMFDKRSYKQKELFELNKKVERIYFSIDNYGDDKVATPGYIELESDFSFGYTGLSEEATVVGNLQKRQDKTLNENLIRQIAIDNPQLFRYVQKFHKTLHVSKTSLSHLPKDVSISYALKHSADIYTTGRYKDRNNRHKKWNNSKRRLGTSSTKYHSKHKVKVTGKSTVKIKKSHKKKTSKYIDFSQGI